jgi:hypothetical protein
MLRRILLILLGMLALQATAVAQAPPAVPALPDTERRTTYSITGSKCACAVNMALYGDGTDYQSWVEVFVNGTRVNYNDPTFGWTITSPTGQLGSIPRPVTDGILTFTNNQTGTIQIVGARRPRRTTQFQENKGVAARDLNQAITDLVAQNREAWDKINDVTGRGLFFAPGNTVNLIPSPPSCAGMVLGFDASGLNPVCVAAGGGGGGGNVISVNGTPGQVTVSPTTGVVIVSLPTIITQAETWGALQTFNAGMIVNGSFTATGLVTNTDLQNSSIVVNGVTCTLGSTCSSGLAIGQAISGSTNGFLLYANSGVLGNISLSTLLATPPAIGGTTPAAGSFTTLSASGAASLATITSGTWNGSVIGLAFGGTNNALTASNGGVVWSDASKLNILAGTVTAGQCLLSGSSAAPSWGSCSGAAAVSSVANSDGTLTVSPTTGAVIASLALGHANTWTAAQTFTNSDLVLLGSSTGATTFTSDNAGASNFILHVPAATSPDTIDTLGAVQTITAAKTFQGTTNFTGSLQASGNTMTFPSAVATLAALNLSQSFTAGQAVTPTADGTQSPGGTLTMDFSASNFHTATFGAGNLTIANPSNVKAGECGWLALTQDGVGNRLATWGTNWKWSGATAPTLSTAASAVDLLSWCAISTTVIAAQLAINNYH